MSFIASIDAGGQCGQAVVVAGVAIFTLRPACAAGGGCATHKNTMFAAAEHDVQ
jgi:hypothetical protein